MARLEGLEVTPLRNGVAISAEGGIALSSQESIRRARKRRKISEPLRAPLLAIADWRGADVGEFYPQRRALQRAVVEAPDAGRNVARWELAKFNFSRNFMADARAVLELMLAQDAAATSDPALRAMRGLLSVLAHRNDEAAADLLHVALDGRPDTQLWRGLLLKSEGNMVAANQAFASAAAALTLLPEDWRRRLLFEWAEAAVAAEDESSFKMVEELLSELEIPVARRGQLEFLKGRAAEIRQEPDVALEHYEAVIAGGSRRARIRAAVARVNLMLESGTTTRDQAVAALEELTHAWRGDTHEIALLNRLADLRLEAKDYAGALDLMRRVVTNFPNRPEVAALAQRMNQVFETVFLEGEAEAMSPVSTLALFYDFQELTPVGQAGDEIIRKLADRLVQVDLLDRAARLLEHQVRHRLKGADRARIAARLALIYLMDRRPKEALETLQRSRSSSISAALANERRHLEARALADLGRGDGALTLLDGDDSRARLHLRREIDLNPYTSLGLGGDHGQPRTVEVAIHGVPGRTGLGPVRADPVHGQRPFRVFLP